MQQHYFSARPSSPSKPGTVDLVLPDLRLTLDTDAGVFSPQGVDAGTKLLLLDGPAPDAAAAGPFLDLGCGYGPIACALGRRAPDAEVWAVDVNERARELCVANADRAGLDGVRVAAPEDVPADLSFAGIWSNPPIRIGKPALHALLLDWLPRLEPGAKAWLVVHKHLGADSLAGWLGASIGPTTRVSSRAGYRILEVAPDR
ncbi:MAG: methyltransferase [Acidimicrobiia bacterium]|nr:methyltransferase [Acidimicrobiia bacterium]